MKIDSGARVSSIWDDLQSAVGEVPHIQSNAKTKTVRTFCKAAESSGLADGRISSTCLEGQVGTCAILASEIM